ncbi:MAG: CDP-glycerol glycerophosphotransferase family protein [Pseudoclavibacter sp.]
MCAQQDVEVAVLFADPPRNLYQMRQWYGPLQRLAERHRLAVVCCDPDSARTVADESGLPVRVRSVWGAVGWLRAQRRLGLALYVNQNSRNILFTRVPGPCHVHVNHGESDKRSMTSNLLRMFDRVFVAGQASIDRISRALRLFDARRMVPIGRPQLDVPLDAPADLPPTDLPTVLYAPTWEGGRPSMRYGSGPTHGEAIVTALLADGRHRVIYRPHPRTGTHLERFAAADARIRGLLRAEIAAYPQAGHYIDDTPRFGWQTAAADVAVCDISSVDYDWIASGKPILVTQPADARAHIECDGIAGQVPMLTAADAPRVLERLEAATGAESRQRLAALARYHFGDTTPGASMRRFLEACDAVMRER